MTGNVIMTGPILTGRAGPIMEGICEAVQEQIAQYALERVHYQLNAHIKNPTPYYETQITRQRLRGDEVVHDRGIIYGPWLEGVSHRNARSRFKGYHSFRTATQETERRAPDIADRVIAGHLRQLGS